MKINILQSFFLIFFLLCAPQFLYSQDKIYKCIKNNTTGFQSAPCEGHLGKTHADRLKEEQDARQKRLEEVKFNEEKRQQEMQNANNNERGFKYFLSNCKKSIINFWNKIKAIFSS